MYLLWTDDFSRRHGRTRVTDDLTGAGAVSVSKRYVVGPELDIGLPSVLALKWTRSTGREGFQSSYSNIFYGGS